MKRIYIASGIPGSGKSTWIQKRVQSLGGLYISRDVIRFSLLNDEDDYFAKEILVFQQFINLIQAGIDTPEVEDIYIDATHLNEKSRRKVLDRLNLTKVDEIIVLFFDVKLSVALNRNAKREGRAYVPETAIQNMYYSLEKPAAAGKYNYTIWTIDENGVITYE